LKARFARPRDIYENLNEWHLPKIRRIGAGAAPRDRDAVVAASWSTGGVRAAADQPRRHSGAASVNAAFTIQPIVHHSTGYSPSRANGPRRARESRARTGENTAARFALAFV